MLQIVLQKKQLFRMSKLKRYVHMNEYMHSQKNRRGYFIEYKGRRYKISKNFAHMHIKIGVFFS